MEMNMSRLNELLRRIKDKIQFLGCKEVGIGNFGDDLQFDGNMDIGVMVIDGKDYLDEIENGHTYNTENEIMNKIKNTVKIFDRYKTIIFLCARFDNNDDNIVINYGCKQIDDSKEELHNALTTSDTPCETVELSFTDKIINGLKSDAESLSRHIGCLTSQPDYKMLINNLKTTMELIQELEGKASPTTINIGTITLDNVTNADDFLNQLKTRYNNILNKK